MEFLPEEEQQLLSQYVFLPLVLKVFNRDRLNIAHSSIRLKEPYMSIIEQASIQAEKDHGLIRKTLRERGVRIYKERRHEQGLELCYAYRGYHHQTEYKWEFLKGKVLFWMHWYLQKKSNG